MTDESVTYDANVIQSFADRLYREAIWIIYTGSFFGLIAGAIIGIIMAVVLQQRDNLAGATILGAVLGGLVGYSRGRERAFKLKLEAQQALCNVEIEKNTSILKGLVRSPKPPAQ